MKNFTPTLIAYLSIWGLLIGYQAWVAVRKLRISEKIRNLNSLK